MLTRELASTGAGVIAIGACPNMLDAARAELRALAQVEVVGASAEASTLRDAPIGVAIGQPSIQSTADRACSSVESTSGTAQSSRSTSSVISVQPSTIASHPRRCTSSAITSR